MLAIEFDNVREEVVISFDIKGAEKLIDTVRRLKASKKELDHDHLMTPSWGGHELDELPIASGSTLVHHLRLVWLAQS